MTDLIQSLCLVALGLLVVLAIVAIRRMQKRLNDYMRAMNALKEANAGKKKKRHLWLVPAFVPLALAKNHPVVIGTIAAGSIGTLLLVAPMVTDDNTLSRPPPTAAGTPTLDNITELPTATAQGTQPNNPVITTTHSNKLGEQSTLPTELASEQPTLTLVLPVPEPQLPAAPQPTLPRSLPSQTRLPSPPSPTELQPSPIHLPTRLPIATLRQLPSHEHERQLDGMGRSTG